MQPVSTAQDRSIALAPGSIVVTGYVPIFSISLACRERMAMGDVNSAYQKRLQMGDKQSWPPPVGYWQEGRFVIQDGRHEYVAAVMLGLEYLFVAWEQKPSGLPNQNS